jgi:hypothetical protein
LADGEKLVSVFSGKLPEQQPGGGDQPEQRPGGGGPTPQAYEYLVVDYATGATVEDLSIFLNVYGADGWQLVTVDLSASTTRRAIFTRPI